MLADLRVLDGAVLVDHEGRALGHATHDEIGFGKELVVGDPVGLGDGVLVIAEEFDRDALFLGPGFLGEGVVAGNPDDGGIKCLVVRDSCGNVAELLGADAGESHRHEEQHDIGFSHEIGELHEFGAVRAFGDEGEIRCFVAFLKCHVGRWFLGSGRA